MIRAKFNDENFQLKHDGPGILSMVRTSKPLFSPNAIAKTGELTC